LRLRSLPMKRLIVTRFSTAAFLTGRGSNPLAPTSANESSPIRFVP
jgi:hypothetical protein